MAEQIDVSVEFYARIERGVAKPSIETFARMVGVLDVSADELLGIDASVAPELPPLTTPDDSPELCELAATLLAARHGTLRLIKLLLNEIDRAKEARRRSRARGTDKTSTESSDGEWGDEVALGPGHDAGRIDNAPDGSARAEQTRRKPARRSAIGAHGLEAESVLGAHHVGVHVIILCVAELVALASVIRRRPGAASHGGAGWCGWCGCGPRGARRDRPRPGDPANRHVDVADDLGGPGDRFARVAARVGEDVDGKKAEAVREVRVASPGVRLIPQPRGEYSRDAWCRKYKKVIPEKEGLIEVTAACSSLGGGLG